MIRDRPTGLSVPASVGRATAGDLRSLGAGWNFDWEDEARRSDVYKLLTEEDPGANLGLVAVDLREGFVEITLLECSPGNVGREKRFEGIAGSMIAFAAGLSFDTGCEGYVAMESKTNLIDHYCRTYGLERIGMSHRLFLARDAATRLVRQYLGKEI
ncbi:MAG TPA: hypothetical protein VGH33_09025 [Isosphaeraceae bacterium]|jgi:hypothetical protein